MTRVTKAILRLNNVLSVLDKFKDSTPVKPENNAIYTTFNDSLVYVYTDAEGRFMAIVLKGGHGVRSLGERRGESYMIDEDGYYNDQDARDELVMSLAKKIETNLEQ